MLILSDHQDEDSNLARMVGRLAESYSEMPEVLNIHELDIKGPCLECLQCGIDNECVWDDKDGFRAWYESVYLEADVIVFAGSLSDRFLSSRWRLFWDRTFCHNHQPMLTGKQVAFVISGPLAQNANVRQILQAWTEMHQANLAGIVTDEVGDSTQLDALLQNLAQRLSWNARQGYVKPPTFLGVGGRKLFRDEIWGPLRFVFWADHKYYKRHGLYDFPQKDWKMRIYVGLMSLLVQFPPGKRVFQRVLMDKMNEPGDRILAEM